MKHWSRDKKSSEHLSTTFAPGVANKFSQERCHSSRIQRWSIIKIPLKTATQLRIGLGVGGGERNAAGLGKWQWHSEALKFTDKWAEETRLRCCWVNFFYLQSHLANCFSLTVRFRGAFHIAKRKKLFRCTHAHTHKRTYIDAQSFLFTCKLAIWEGQDCNLPRLLSLCSRYPLSPLKWLAKASADHA